MNFEASPKFVSRKSRKAWRKARKTLPKSTPGLWIKARTHPELFNNLQAKAEKLNTFKKENIREFVATK